MTVWRGSLFFQLATHSGVGCQSSVLTCSSLMTMWRGSLFFQPATHSGVGCRSSVLTCSSLMTVWRGSLFFQLATHSGVGCQSSAALLEVLEVRLSNFLLQENLCYLSLAGAILFYKNFFRFLLFLSRNTILKDNLSS
jgi:hypothetical protein